MTLGQKQKRFTYAIACLIDYAYAIGYQLSFGDAYRSPSVKYGHDNSTHRARLAVDFNIFLDGVFLQDGSGHDKLHDFWDTLGGAKRIDNDLNHYSFEHNGVR